MRKWLIFLFILVIGVVGALFWLGQSLNSEKPEPGEVRIEVDHVF